MWHPALTYDIIWLQVYFMLYRQNDRWRMWGFCWFWIVFSLVLLLCLAVVFCPSLIIIIFKKNLHGVIRCKQVLVYPLKERKEALWMFCLYNQHISTPGYPRDSYIISCNALKLLSPALIRCAAFLTVAPVLGVSACMHASLVAPCPSVSHRVRMWVLVIYNPCLCFVENVQTDIDAL